MRKTLMPVVLISLLLSSCNKSSDIIINLKYDDNLSLEYHEVIDAYQKLADHYGEAKLMDMGETDIGKPLHLFMMSKDKDFDPASIRKKGKCIILINNGIHPGEPEGIDASIQFAWDMLRDKNELKHLLDNVVIGIIPVYNIGGSLDRSEYYRTNQNGPIIKARRRNARNLDLNRDFAKQESKNAQTFATIFNFLNPDAFVDTHTTNGSDHQYTLTLIATLHSKLEPGMGTFYKNKMLPGLYKQMEDNSEYGMIPYVYSRSYGDIRAGILSYNDHPYYSTGYTSLFNCYSFMTENLVYKYFPDRVRSVIDFLTELSRFTYDNADEIRKLKDEADNNVKTQEEFHLAWKVDMSYSEDLQFKGYEYVRPEPTEGNRRARAYYDHEKPYTDTIPFFTKYDPVLTVTKPYAYIIPQAWSEVALKLHNSGIEISRLKNDTEFTVESYYIEDYYRPERTSQGRNVMTNVKVRKEEQTMQYYKGDYVVIVNQRYNKFIVEMLEPHAPNSFFAWNFFDPILEGHDYYSIWGFESHLMEMLDDDESLKAKMEEMKAADEEFANDPVAQLQFLYEKAPMYEIEKYNHLYPVARLASKPD